MNKPILDHYGCIITAPNELEVVWCTLPAIATEDACIELLHFDSDEDAADLNRGSLYATREAAEMAVIRAKCIRRLKVMAYEDGWLPDFNDPMPRQTQGQVGAVKFPVWFKNQPAWWEAEKTIIPEETAALYYIYKPEEDEGV